MEQCRYDFFVGTYTDNTGSAGIYRIRLDASGRVKSAELAVTARNPSYLCTEGDMLYAVNEYENGGTVVGYRIEEQKCGKLWTTELDSAGICHAFYSPVHDFILLSSYLGGDYYCIRASDGCVLSHILHEHRDDIRSHAHCAVTDRSGRFILCADLGQDTVTAYAIADGRPSAVPSFLFDCKKGSGPRQLVFHPRADLLFVANELDSSVSSFKYNPSLGELDLLQNVPASDAGIPGENFPAGITATSDGRMLYVSNRGADTIAAFNVLPSGLIIKAGESSCGGEFPRHIMLTADDRFLVISNQRSGRIVVCPVDHESGSIGSPTASVDIPAPSCTVEYNK